MKNIKLSSYISVLFLLLLLGCKPINKTDDISTITLNSIATPSITTTIDPIDILSTQSNNPIITKPTITQTKTEILTPTKSIPDTDKSKYWTSYLSTTDVVQIAFDSKNNLWTYGSGGLESWNIATGSYKKYQITEKLIRVNENPIREILEGPDGWMWFATDIGIARFNGEQWNFLTETDGLIDDSVITMAKGADGAMWVGTHEGLSKWVDGKWTSFTRPDQLLHDTVSIVIDHKETVWVASMYGLSSYDGENWITYSYDWGRGGGGGPITYPSDLAIAPNGTVWGASGFFIFHITGGEIVSQRLEEAYARWGTPDITDIVFDKNGALWITTDRAGIVRFDGNSWVNYTNKWGLLDWDYSTTRMEPVLLGPDNAMWFGTRGYGVIRTDGYAWTSYYNNGLRTSKISSIGVGLDNFIWFGDRSTITRYNGDQWKTYELDQELEYWYSISSIATGPDGDIWVGGCWEPVLYNVILNSIWRFHNGEWIVYTSKSRPGSECVLSIANAPDGSMWFSTYEHGIWRYDGKEWNNIPIKDTLGSDGITDMVFEPNGKLWASTGRGIACFDGITWINYTTEKGLPGKTIFPPYYVLGIDLLGKIWIGYYTGAAYFNGKEWITAFHSDFPITSIMATPDGSMWFGTSSIQRVDDGNGLYRYNNGEITIYNSTDGLLNDTVLDIILGPDEAIWLGTEGGIVRFDYRKIQ